MRKNKVFAMGVFVFLFLTSCSGEKIFTHHDGNMTPGKDIGTYLPSDSIEASTVMEAGMSEIMVVKHGQTIDLSPMVVRKTINGKEQVMFGYRGQIPGPLLKVEQGSEFYVNVTNDIPLPTTNHWHGLRLDNAFDGMPGISQAEIQPEGSFRYTVKVPDAGLFWYHPHVREDIEQDLGLYGNILVTPKNAAKPPVDREETLMLDDLLLDASGKIAPYGKEGATHVMMGRYGNVMLLNGQTDYSLDVRQGDVVRLYLTNTANARPFRIGIPGASMKVIASDMGPYEKEERIEWLVIGPAERYVVDVLFPQSGKKSIMHRGGGEPVEIGTINVRASRAASVHTDAFLRNHTVPDALSPVTSPDTYLDGRPDEILRISYSGMNHGTVTGTDGIEWEDSMPMMNAMTNQGNFSWKLVDDRTGKANMDVHWTFGLGDRKKIRMINDDESMQHPIHFHGQRFLVLSVDGKPVENRAWKDTFMLRSGETADVLLELTNPGTWMFHCHIAEHLQDGMMGLFTVE